MNTEHSSDLALLQRLVEQLGEHFDSVQLFVTRHESSEGGTVNLAWGKGNWFARYGQVKEWCVKEEEAARCAARARADEEEH